MFNTCINKRKMFSWIISFPQPSMYSGKEFEVHKNYFLYNIQQLTWIICLAVKLFIKTVYYINLLKNAFYLTSKMFIIAENVLQNDSTVWLKFFYFHFEPNIEENYHSRLPIASLNRYYINSCWIFQLLKWYFSNC